MMELLVFVQGDSEHGPRRGEEGGGEGEGRDVQPRICYRNGREGVKCTGVGGGKDRYMKTSEWSMWGTEEKKRKKRKIMQRPETQKKDRDQKNIII
jgi:hypothetical protein